MTWKNKGALASLFLLFLQDMKPNTIFFLKRNIDAARIWGLHEINLLNNCQNLTLIKCARLLDYDHFGTFNYFLPFIEILLVEGLGEKEKTEKKRGILGEERMRRDRKRVKYPLSLSKTLCGWAKTATASWMAQGLRRSLIISLQSGSQRNLPGKKRVYATSVSFTLHCKLNFRHMQSMEYVQP